MTLVAAGWAAAPDRIIGSAAAKQQPAGAGPAGDAAAAAQIAPQSRSGSPWFDGSMALCATGPLRIPRRGTELAHPWTAHDPAGAISRPPRPIVSWALTRRERRRTLIGIPSAIYAENKHTAPPPPPPRPHSAARLSRPTTRHLGTQERADRLPGRGGAIPIPSRLGSLYRIPLAPHAARARVGVDVLIFVAGPGVVRQGLEGDLEAYVHMGRLVPV